MDIYAIDKDQLYISVNSWFVETFNSAESVIEFQDKEAGRIMGKYIYEYSDTGYIIQVRSVITVDVKDQKIRIRCSDHFSSSAGASRTISFIGK